MRAVVVFESMFGNTRAIADAVAEGLRRHIDVEVMEVGRAGSEADADLLVVGGPTRAFGMSRPATREDAAKRGAVVSRTTGVREWLGGLSGDGRGRAVAAFDTRIRVRGLPGSAARGVAKQLRRRGYELVVPPESFYVSDTEGPLRTGELDRARQWGDRLGRACLSTEPAWHPA